MVYMYVCVWGGGGGGGGGCLRIKVGPRDLPLHSPTLPRAWPVSVEMFAATTMLYSCQWSFPPTFYQLLALLPSGVQGVKLQFQALMHHVNILVPCTLFNGTFNNAMGYQCYYDMTSW